MSNSTQHDTSSKTMAAIVVAMVGLIAVVVWLLSGSSNGPEVRESSTIEQPVAAVTEQSNAVNETLKDEATDADRPQRNARYEQDKSSTDLIQWADSDETRSVSRALIDSQPAVNSDSQQQESATLTRNEAVQQKALEYIQQRREVIAKCKDYEILGMLEENEFECLDYLAEKRANQRATKRAQEARELKKKYESEDDPL